MVEECQDCEDDRALFYDSFDTGLPFTEIEISDNRKVRKFEKDTPEHLLKWHADDEDRFIKAFKMTDWLFQFDNELPSSGLNCLNNYVFLTQTAANNHLCIGSYFQHFLERSDAVHFRHGNV